MMRGLWLALTPFLFAEPPLPITSIRFSPDGRTLAIAQGNRVRLVAEHSDRTIPSRLAQVFAVAWSGDGKWLAAGGGSAAVFGGVEIWDAASGQLVRTVARCGDLVYAVAFSPDSQRLAAASADQRATIVDLASGDTRFRLSGHVGPVLSVAYSSDGQWLATGSADRSIRLWSASAGTPLRALTNHNGAVEAVVFSHDNQTLYSASSDATVRVWVPSNGRMRRILRGYDQPVLALEFLASRQLLLTGSADGSVRLAHPETGEVVETIAKQASAWSQAVAVSADGAKIAWADTSGRHTIRGANP